MRGHDGLILRVLVGCTHVIWLVLYVVTNRVLWMPPRAIPCDLAPGMAGGHAIGSAWHDMAAGDGREGICHACLVALVQLWYYASDTLQQKTTRIRLQPFQKNHKDSAAAHGLVAV